MKSRLAITAILVLGLVTGGTGTTLAVSGGSHSAAQVQYPSSGNHGAVLGKTQQNGQVLGTTQSSGNASAPVQANQQVAATNSNRTLPFTGLAAIPLIVLGLALLGAGGLLYRSSRRAPSEA